MIVKSFSLRVFSSCIFVTVRLKFCFKLASTLDLYFLKDSIVFLSVLISNYKACSFETLLIF
jgi:hypothetical protein